MPIISYNSFLYIHTHTHASGINTVKKWPPPNILKKSTIIALTETAYCTPFSLSISGLKDWAFT